MIKKIILLFFCITLLVACGKKKVIQNIRIQNIN